MLDILKKKSVEKIMNDAEGEGEAKGMKRVLTAWDLTAIGIGCIIGTGIFVLTGEVAVKHAGPGIMLSFIISGLACVFAALCYAEFASLVPISGSAYTYGYATLGELFAWIIGWDLILEYAIAAGAVSIGWASYFLDILHKIGSYFGAADLPQWIEDLAGSEGHVNFVAAFIILTVTTLLVVGIKESANVNSVIVVIKVTIALVFIGVGAFFINPANWSPLIPKFVAVHEVVKDQLELPLLKLIATSAGYTLPEGFGGWPGIFTGAALVFFAYIGFDAVSTTAEEAKNPKRDLPIGIIASLIISTVLYIAISAIFTGIVRCDGTLKPSDMGDQEGAPLIYAFNMASQMYGQPWLGKFVTPLISLGAICGITSVLLVTLMGQARVFFAMSRDRLLPRFIAKIHPKFKTPYITTIATGIVVAFIAAVTPIGIIAELANIGTLFAFVIVCAGLIFLRRIDCGERGQKCFKTPLFPIIPILGIAFSVFLMISLPIRTWYRFLGWMILGLTIYFCYSYFRSELREQKNPSLQVLIGSFVGVIYLAAQLPLIKFYETLFSSHMVAAVFVALISIVLLVISVYKGATTVKTCDSVVVIARKGYVSIAIGIAGLAIWIYLLASGTVKLF